MTHKLLTFLFLFSLVPISAEEGFVPLFDGKTLKGWHSAKKAGGAPHGVFTVSAKDQAIHVYANEKAGTKQEIDCLYTEEEFSHFVLRMQYRWGDKRFAPRIDWDRDAGLLFHICGDPKKVWPDSLEMQIGESPGDKTEGRRFHSGDLWVIGKTLRAQVSREGRFYDDKAPLVWVGMDKAYDSCLVKGGSEKPHGEWNDMEIRVEGAKKATFILNGEVVLEMQNFQRKDGDTYKPLSSGRIGLQAEYAELQYRNIRIKKLNPAKLRPAIRR